MSQKLRGFVAQGMNGKKAPAARILAQADSSTGSGSITATNNCVALIYGFGGGGSGGSLGGGGGGGAVYKRARIGAGQTITYSAGAGGAIATAGNDGGDTVITLPSGLVLKATGGRAGNNGRAGGTGVGGDVNRTGGAGGAINAAGGSGEDGGGVGGLGNASGGGGGGCAGLVSVTPGLAYGIGAPPTNGATGPGGASGGSSPGGSGFQGEAGRVLILFVRISGG